MTSSDTGPAVPSTGGGHGQSTVTASKGRPRGSRLELTWVGKDVQQRLEPRILIEDTARSYHAQRRVSDTDIFENALIHGDNLLALKALEERYTNSVKCVYIDPPFNTQQAFELYDDGVEHSLWLSLMRDRLTILHRLLRRDGTLFVHIDDNELGYLVVLLDEIFGRRNRLYVVTFKQGSATGHKAINPGCVNTSNFILIYAKDKSAWTPNRVFTARERDSRYNQYIENVNAPFAKWRIVPLMKGFADARGISEKEARALAKKNPDAIDEFVLNNAAGVVQLARPDYNAVSKAARELIDASKDDPDKIFRLERDGHSDIYLSGGQRILFYTDKLKTIDGKRVAGEPLTTIWDDILSNNLHKEGGIDFPKGKKPEALIKRVLELATKPGDLVLDSFAGSGTTGAVAHKMGRRWIMIELKDHALTHIVPRLRSVVDGSDPNGITDGASWRGGGGYRYYRLASSLLTRDEHGQWVISPSYNAPMLAEALCKHEGFRYDPSPTVYWQQGRSSERDFLFVTTQTLTREQLQALSAEVGPRRSLLVLCGAFRGPVDDLENLTVRKIPQAVLHRCEWGKDDYSLSIASLPGGDNTDLDADVEADAPSARSRASTTGTATAKSRGKRKGRHDTTTPLFGQGG